MATPAAAPAFDSAELKQRIDHFHSVRDQILAQVHQVIVGQEDVLEQILIGLFVGGHCLITGLPGTAKTLMVRTIAQTLGLIFKRIQFTPDLMPSDITGTDIIEEDPTTGRRRWTFVQGPIFGNILLADEINRTPPKTQSALLEAMQERQVTIEGDRFELPAPFMVLATQNPVDLEGTYPLPEAQIDRFLVRVTMGYPTAREEAMMLKAHGVEPPVVRAVLSGPDVSAMQAIGARIHVEDDLHDYAVAITGFTRSHPRVALGASPRATLALVQASKAWALLNGRTFVVPDDLRAIASPVLAHRLVLTADTEPDAKAREQVVEEALAKVSYRRGVRAV